MPKHVTVHILPERSDPAGGLIHTEFCVDDSLEPGDLVIGRRLIAHLVLEQMFRVVEIYVMPPTRRGRLRIKCARLELAGGKTVTYTLGPAEVAP